jgi:hypothetical protein
MKSTVRPLQAVRPPSRHRLERRQHLLEAIAQILQYMVAVHPDTVPGMDRRRRTADQDSPGKEMPLGR